MNSACIASSLLTYHGIQHESLVAFFVLSVPRVSFPLVAIDADDELLRWLLLLVCEDGLRVVVNVTIGPNDF
jgi:hypothetical protein